MGFLNNYPDNVPTIPEFFKGKTIFITGGSGFMGKVLIEKLLYSCTDLERIYILLRCKKGIEPKDRLAELYKSNCFNRLRDEKPDVFPSKVTVIPGDVMELGLGISPEDHEILINNVNIVFHVAASVRFDDTLKVAAKLNLRGTREVVELSKKMKHLKCLIHTSTSYSNTNRNPVDEVMYPPHADWRDILQMVEEVDDHTLNVLTPKVLGNLPNTYTFTKQLGEHVVYEQRGTLPAIIFRPSIVISSYEEPTTGWIENFNGPAGLMVATGKGILRCLYSDPDLISDYIPVDTAIRALITAAWSRGTRPLAPSDDIPIINCCAGSLNVVTNGDTLEMGRNLTTVCPLDNVVWAFGADMTNSSTEHYIKVILLHLLPALLVDTILWLSGKKPRLTRIQRKIYIANVALAYYGTKQWTFSNKNLLALRSSLKEEDREQFYGKIEEIDKDAFFLNAAIGGKKYLLKEKDDDLEKAKAHYNRMWVVDKIVRAIFYILIARWVYNFSCVQDSIIAIQKYY